MSDWFDGYLSKEPKSSTTNDSSQDNATTVKKTRTQHVSQKQIFITCENCTPFICVVQLCASVQRSNKKQEPLKYKKTLKSGETIDDYFATLYLDDTILIQPPTCTVTFIDNENTNTSYSIFLKNPIQKTYYQLNNDASNISVTLQYCTLEPSWLPFPTINMDITKR